MVMLFSSSMEAAKYAKDISLIKNADNKFYSSKVYMNKKKRGWLYKKE